MTLRTGKRGRYRYYACSIKTRQHEIDRAGRTVPVDKLDTLVTDQIEQRLLQPARLETILAPALDRRKERAERCTLPNCASVRPRPTPSPAGFYDVIENGVALAGMTARINT
jgi:hypothetical protein